MLLILNEWFFHDLLLQNGEDKFKETSRFVIDLEGSGTKLVVPAKGRWKRKAYQLMTMEVPKIREVSKLFHSIILDSARTVLADPEVIAKVPQAACLGVPSEDIYLVKAYLGYDADLLVTTDQELHDSLASNSNVNCELRGDFLRRFRQENNIGHP